MKRSWIALLTVLTYLVDKHAQQTIEYLKEEIGSSFRSWAKSDSI
jgi:hypothetical protein